MAITLQFYLKISFFRISFLVAEFLLRFSHFHPHTLNFIAVDFIIKILFHMYVHTYVNT